MRQRDPGVTRPLACGGLSVFMCPARLSDKHSSTLGRVQVMAAALVEQADTTSGEMAMFPGGQPTWHRDHPYFRDTETKKGKGCPARVPAQVALL